MADHSIGGYDLFILLAGASRVMVDELHRHLAALGFDDVRPAHGFAFVRLAPDGATGNELAEHLGVSKQAASQMVDYLEQHGYVTRRPHPRDGRGKIVVLTARGWECIRATESALTDIERRAAAVIGDERLAMLRDDVRRLISAVSDNAPSPRLRPIW
ncbi:MAG: MarR family winged helix-turn-helix transcriptional regulator [Thermomicrobiales bacterium]